MTRDSNRSSDDKPWKSAFAGAMGGLALVAVGYPFDLIKTRIQLAPDDKKVGAMQECRRIIKVDGFRGLYRGASPVFLGVAPVYALLFWGYDLGQKIALKVFPNDAKGSDEPLIDRLSLRQVALAGGFSGIPTTLILGPAERIKILLQNQEGKSPGVMNVIQQTWNRGGWKDLSRGTFATLLRDAGGSIAYFAIYEGIKRSLSSETSKLQTSLGIIFAGGMAGMAHWSLIMPIDVIKSRYQADLKYTGLVETATKLLKHEGWASLYKGIVPALARAFPANAASFGTVELVKSLL